MGNPPTSSWSVIMIHSFDLHPSAMVNSSELIEGSEKAENNHGLRSAGGRRGLITFPGGFSEVHVPLQKFNNTYSY